MAGTPSLVLRTPGRRSGQPRTAVLPFARDGSGLVGVAPNWGSDRPPAWLLNLSAQPRAEVQIGPRWIAVEPRIVEGDDPDHPRLWRLANSNNRHRYEGYLAMTSRPIAIVVLDPAG